MKLIDADALKELFPDNGEGSWTYNITARMYIDNAPTVVPEYFMNSYEEGYERARKDFERPQGEWKAKNFHTLYCNNCNFEFDIMKCDFLENMKNCPNCGAKMKGAEE